MTFASRTQFHIERQWGLKSVLNVKAVVATFNQENALIGVFFVITNLRMDLFEALPLTPGGQPWSGELKCWNQRVINCVG